MQSLHELEEIERDELEKTSDIERQVDEDGDFFTEEAGAGEPEATGRRTPAPDNIGTAQKRPKPFELDQTKIADTPFAAEARARAKAAAEAGAGGGGTGGVATGRAHHALAANEDTAALDSQQKLLIQRDEIVEEPLRVPPKEYSPPQSERSKSSSPSVKKQAPVTKSHVVPVEEDLGKYIPVDDDDQALRFQNNFEQLGISRRFTSRRVTVYNDDNSELDDGAPEQTVVTTVGTASEMKPCVQMLKHRHVFGDLVTAAEVVTRYTIASVIINYESTRALCVTQKDDNEYWIQQYSLSTNELTYQEQIGGGVNDFIKCKEIEQSPKGDRYVICYCNDGVFYFRDFDKNPSTPELERTPEQIERSTVNVNDLVGLQGNNTMCHDTFHDPYITCCFVDQEVIFVNFFENFSLTHYHFFYNLNKRSVVGNIHSRQMEGTMIREDFPIKSFCNEDLKEVYCFYRKGHAFIINIKKGIQTDEYQFDQITDKNLGQMVLVYGEALIVQCSTDILFFKIEVDEETGDRMWAEYQQIQMPCTSLYYIKGNIRIQIVTDIKIYFYLIDKKTFEPTLENVMKNYMMCSQMMFGSKVRYSITYKSNETSFIIYRRKFEHDFKQSICTDNFENSIGLELFTTNQVLITQIDKVLLFDQDSFQVTDQLPITLMQSEEREPNQIIAVCKNQSESRLAVISGKFLIKDAVKTNQLFIFQRMKNPDTGIFKYKQLQRVVLKTNAFFDKVCMKFYFKRDDDKIIFARFDSIFELDLNTEQHKVLYKYEQPFQYYPTIFVCNADQTIWIVGSRRRIKYINLEKGTEYSFENDWDIQEFRNVVLEQIHNNFIVVANRMDDQLGFYLFQFNVDDPSKENVKFLVKYVTRLEIGDVDIYVLNVKEGQQGFLEIVCGYKTIYLNTYNVISIDISRPDLVRNLTVYRHESFQLWESESKGILLAKNKDFITLNKQGVQVLNMGGATRTFTDHSGQRKMAHSLESYSFLKLIPDNHLLFECQDPNNRQLTISQENRFQVDDNRKVQYQPLYKVKIWNLTLRELLLFKSLYTCRTLSEILEIVQDQPKPLLFFKSCLELNGGNITSYLTFDSRSISELLDPKNEEFFSSEFPLFYQNKFIKSGSSEDQAKFYFRWAIENCLRSNQIKAVDCILNYITNYQNNYTSSYQLRKIMPELMEKGLKIKPLLDSQIFNFDFDFDSWPGNHTSDAEEIRPYNGTIYNVSLHYKTVFHEDEFNEVANADIGKDQVVYKIRYSLNLLPCMGQYCQINSEDPNKYELLNKGVNFLEMCNSSEEIEMFGSQSLQDLIAFKWNSYGQKVHLLSLFIHILFLIILFAYNIMVYIEGQEDAMLVWVMLAIVMYPTIYELVLIKQTGVGEYFSDFGNVFNTIYIYSAVAMSVVHASLGAAHIASKWLTCINGLLVIRRTFYILKIFESLSPIVTMLIGVIIDLKDFMTFYFIQCMLFSLMLGVLGVTGGFDEYEKLGYLGGNFFTMMRLSMGDGALLGVIKDRSSGEQIMLWIVWLLAVVVNCIVFMNFIVAQASATYANVSEQLENFIQSERASLISQAEKMLPSSMNNQNNFPKYIVTRKIVV